MASGDDYRVKAAELNARGQREKNPLISAEYDKLALAYLLLADQADRNATADIVYETPPPPNTAGVPQPQQQQQPQPERLQQEPPKE